MKGLVVLRVSSWKRHFRWWFRLVRISI